ncbi:hypothetical protein CF67_14064 [Candidatus Photodesmus blepharus]|uniref:Uncharacterized protein n=1 Tax=Candidatus Photodesmus blepharonis TaxID=1179155 RepID=A0A084CP26_9GAMM|nr:hypothetical protein CF67_14064 [Candidatus Photodesmus blepharus]
MIEGCCDLLYTGLDVIGTLNLHNDNQIHIEGTVSRIDDDEVILQLTRGPSFRDMLLEQRYIHNKYPTFFNK